MSLDIAPSFDDSSLHITINNRPYKQHEIGSGLLQFIIVLVNAAIKRPRLLLIDEPEINLHPALQLAFLNALGRYADDGVWFSTHSIGLARSAAERVYSVVRDGDGDSKVRPLGGALRLSELLGELSYSSHRELGFESVLLVEGPTDAKALQEFLRKISKDHQILLLPLHGHMPKADELEEILRITSKVAVLIDSERATDGAPLNRDRVAFLDLCRTKSLPSRALDRRAVENYFSDRAVKQVFGSEYRALNPFEKLSEATPHWSKIQNWKLASAMSFMKSMARI